MSRKNPIPVELHNWICNTYLAGKSLNRLASNLSVKLNKKINKTTVKNILLNYNIILRTKKDAYTLRSLHEASQPKKKYTNIEKFRLTSQKRFGTQHPAQSIRIKEKTMATCIQKYGVTCVLQAKHVKEQSKQTCLLKYGYENAIQNEYIKNKVKNTNIQRYGTSWVLNAPEIREKIKKTTLERYGVENILQNKSIQDKIKAANIKKYGVENVFAAMTIREKSKQTMFNRYGCYHAPSWKFICDNYSFDSFPELCFYLYWKTAGKTPIREGLKYKYEYQGKTYWYYPDFSINWQAYEIKGSQFIAKDGTWHNPFDSSKNGEYKAKHQCALANNVKILYKKDYQKYIDWFYNTNHNIKEYKRRLN